MSIGRKRALQQGALALAFASYVGYVAYDRFQQHHETSVENAKRRGRLRAEAKFRLRALEDEARGKDDGGGRRGGETPADR